MNIKSLKFVSELVPLVISGEKYCTWRLWDDKDFEVGDEIELIARPELRVFAKAKIKSIINKRMGKLTEEDKKGHESFKNEQQMYETYSGYYKREVGPNSPLTIYKFDLTWVNPEYLKRNKPS